MNDPRQRLVVDAVAFGSVFRFQRILASITQALRPPRLVVALFVVVALIAGGKVWDDLFDSPSIYYGGLLGEARPDSDAEAQRVLRQLADGSEWYRIDHGLDEFDPIPPGRLQWQDVLSAITKDHHSARRAAERHESPLTRFQEMTAPYFEQVDRIHSVRPRGAFEATAEQVGREFAGVVQSVFALQPVGVYQSFHNLLVKTPIRLWQEKRPFVIFFGLFALFVVSVGGGALCRMSVCEIAGRERLRVMDGFSFAFRQWVRLVLAPLLPLVIAGVLTLILIVLGGALFNIPYLDVLAGAGYIINIALAFISVFVLLAYFVSFPMVLPAVATECADPADALQRAFAYLLTRPLHYLGYSIVALVGLSLGYFVVALVAVMTLNLAATATGTLTGSSATAAAGGFSIFDLSAPAGDPHLRLHHRLAGGAISIWQGLVLLLVAAYVVSYFFTASSHIYMLMRKAVDDQDFSEIWRPGLVPGTLAPMPTAPKPFAPPAPKESPTPAAPDAEDEDQADDAAEESEPPLDAAAAADVDDEDDVMEPPARAKKKSKKSTKKKASKKPKD